jgi:enoyl-CoA hydratase/carnithine racemase
MPFSQLGLCPEFASSLLVAQAAGYTRAAEKLMLGEAFPAQEAFEMGIVAKVVPAAELLAFAQGQAAKLVKLPAASLRTTKALMKRSCAALVQDTIAVENERFSAMLVGGEAKKAFTASSRSASRTSASSTEDLRHDPVRPMRRPARHIRFVFKDAAG